VVHVALSPGAGPNPPDVLIFEAFGHHDMTMTSSAMIQNNKQYSPGVVGKGMLPVRLGKDEMNMVEWPFAVLATVPENTTVLEYGDTIVGRDGKPLRRTWTVHAGTGLSLPIAGDEVVYVALMELAREKDFVSPTVHFSRYELCRRLGWPISGKSYGRIQDALNRLAAVTIIAQNAFWDNRGKTYANVAFHILDEVALATEPGGNSGSLPLSYCTWSDVMFRSFQAGNLKSLDVAFFLSLSTPLCRRIFRYLDKKRYGGRRAFEIGLHRLAFERLGLSRSYVTPAQIKRRLDPAHQELMNRGFLARAEYGTMADGNPKVTYFFAQPTLELPNVDPMAQKLEELGVSSSVARDLAEEHDPEVILLWLEAVRRMDVSDRPAYLVKALREGWTVNERVQKELFAEQEEAKRMEGLRSERRIEGERKETASMRIADMTPAERAQLEEAARAVVRAKLPRARENSRAFQSAVAEEMRRMALEDAG
jgi:hypothetical protein